MVTSGKLRERAGRYGLSFERRIGTPLAYFARFEAPASGAPGDGKQVASTATG
jgi:hypothetical protein